MGSPADGSRWPIRPVVEGADPRIGPVPQRLRAVLTAVVAFLGNRPAVCSGLLTAASSGGELREVLAPEARAS